MKKESFVLYVLIVVSQFVFSQSVWKSSQGTITFTKQAFADWKQTVNQDRISDSVWITRSNTQSIFNIRKDTAYAANAPSGTLWAFGPIDSFATLSYKTFVGLSGGSPQGLIGKNLVLHLVAENIYLDIKFLTYGGGNTGGGFSYIRAVSGSGTTSVHPSSSPATIELMQNYPNPFNPATSISFTLGKRGMTTLKVYDAMGREAATLVNEVLEAGVSHRAQFEAHGLASGVYYARLVSGGDVRVKKLLLMK